MKAFFEIFVVALIVSQRLVFGQNRMAGPITCCNAPGLQGENGFSNQIQAYAQECHQVVSMGGEINTQKSVWQKQKL